MLIHVIPGGWPKIAYQENENFNFREGSKALFLNLERAFKPLTTSLSHTMLYSFIAFANNKRWLQIGIDAEPYNRRVLSTLKGRITNQLDCSEVVDLEPLMIWTAKEAGFKTFSFLGANVLCEIYVSNVKGNEFDVCYSDSNQNKYLASGIWIELCDHIVALCALVNSKTIAQP